MTATTDLDIDALQRWLEERLPGASGVKAESFSRPQGSGFSAETHLFTARYTRAGQDASQRLVLRRETPDPPVYPTQVEGLEVEIDIQYRAMDAIARSSQVPLAALVGYESDPDVLGAPFFVMGFVAGEVPIESPPYTRTGFFVEAHPERRRQMITDGMRVLAQIHSIDWRAAGLGWLVAASTTPGTAHQLALWEGYARRELGDRVHPDLDRAFEWLQANLPKDGPVALGWGDARPGNMIWRDGRCVCVTDFEAVCVSVPEQDLGWWLMFDRWVHETQGAERLPGEPTRDEQRALYERFSGRVVGDTTFHEVFAAARYSAIVVRVMNRTVARGMMPADHTIWLQNPAAACLSDMLEELA